MLPQTAQTNLAHKLLLYQARQGTFYGSPLHSEPSIDKVGGIFLNLLAERSLLIMSDRSGTKAAEEKIALVQTDSSLSKAEEALIRKVLEETDWNLKRSAMLLHIARGTLYSKMGKYNIRRPAMPTLL